MSTPAIETARPARRWGLAAVFCILAAGALWFIQRAARQYGVYDPVSYGDLWPRRGGLIPHMAGGLVAITTGLIQLWLGATQRTGSLHRNLGRIYLGGEWMIRSYTVTFAFVSFRLVDQLLIHWHVAPDDEIDAMTAWACWSVPLLLVEPVLQLRRARRGTLR
jgi:hypothetical protein